MPSASSPCQIQRYAALRLPAATLRRCLELTLEDGTMGPNLEYARAQRYASYTVIVARLGRTVRGWSLVHASGGSATVDVYVEEAFRRQGIGRALMEQARQVAREAVALRLDVESHDGISGSFFAAMGEHVDDNGHWHSYSALLESWREQQGLPPLAV